MQTLFKTIDGLSMTKMNVLHWHLVDAESFPYESASYPKLSELGAYDAKKAVYSASNITDTVLYARMRGVLVLPEIDTPGHTGSFIKGYPEVVTNCW